MTQPFNIECRFYAASGDRLVVDPRVLLDCSWELLEAGGFGQASVTLACPFEYAGIANGSRLDIWAVGTGETVPRYRGIVNTPEAVLDIKEQRKLIAYGLMEDMSHAIEDKIVVWPDGVDLSYYAAEVISDYLARRPSLAIAQDVEATNVSLTRMDMTNTTIRAAMDNIFQSAGRQAVWGWDIDPATLNSRFYLRPRTAAVSQQFFAGKNIKLLSAPAELSPVTNAVKLTGGPALYPQLLTNAAFTNPSLPSASGSGSMLTNGSFEVGSTDWTLSGAVIDDVHSSTFAGAHTGKHYLALGLDGNYAYQQVALPGGSIAAGTQFKCQLYAARQDGPVEAKGTLQLQGIASDGSTVTESSPLLVIDPPSTTWIGGAGSTVLAGDGIELSYVFTNTDTAYIRVTIACTVGSDGKALLIDDVVLFPNGGVGQTGWQTDVQVQGDTANEVPSIDWACREAAWYGAYGVKATVVADSSHQVFIAPVPADHEDRSPSYMFKPTPEAELWAFCLVRMQPGLGAGSVILQYYDWQAGKTKQIQRPETSATTIPDDGEWHLVGLDITVSSKAAMALVQVLFETSGTYHVGVISCRDAATKPSDPSTAPLTPVGLGFIPGTDFEQYVRVDDPALASIVDTVSAVENSITTYGLRESILSNKDVVDWSPNAQTWLANWFLQNAVPVERPRLELTHEPNAIVTPGDGAQVIVSQLAQPGVTFWPSKVTYTWAKTALAVSIEGNNQRPTVAKLLLQASQSSGGGNSVSSIGAVAAAVSQSQSGGGSSSPGGATADAPTAPDTVTASIARYSGSTAYIQAQANWGVNSPYTSDVAGEQGGETQWQYSTDGVTPLGPDGTSATFYTVKGSVWACPQGFASGSLYAHCVNVSANGDVATAVVSGAVAYAAPPLSGVEVEDGGTAVGTRPAINFIEGSNVTLTVTDDSGDDRVNVEIAAAASYSPSAVMVTATGTTIPDGTTAVVCTATSGTQTFTLPAIGADTQPIVISNKRTGTVVEGSGTDTVDGSSSASFGNDCLLVPNDSASPKNWASIHIP